MPTSGQRRTVAAAAACLGALVAVALPWLVWRQSVSDARWVTHTVSARLVISDSVTMLRELEIGMGAGRPVEAAAYNFSAQLRSLEEVVVDNGSQEARIGHLRTYLTQRPPPIADMRRELAAMDGEEQRLFDARTEQGRHSALHFAITYVFAVLVAGVFALLWWRESRRTEHERRLQRDALLVAKQKAETAAQAQGQFLSTMSHEIRTPMNGVIGFTNLLLADAREDQRENLNALHFSANHLLALLNDILDFSKIDAGKLEFEKVALDIAATCNGVVRTLSTIAKEQRVTMQIHGSPMPTMLGDGVRLKQILINLIGNAIKFSEGGRVDIAYRLVEEKTEFTITDTGVGIAKDSLGKIFDAFTQAEPGTTRRFGGTGLGLTIVKKLVEMQGGSIAIESELGRGTRVAFRLPLAVSENAVTAAPVRARANDDVSGMRVLVVEDSPLNLLLARRLLAGWQVSVSEAENGIVAVAKAEAECFDLIFMDLQMPELDGYEAAKRIRESVTSASRRAPIIALTASASVEVAGEVAEAGMNGFLPKPFEVEAMRAILRKYRPHALKPENAPVGKLGTST